MRIRTLFAFMLVAATVAAQDFKLNDSGYYTADGVDVMAFSDFYPEGHQGGVSVLMNGHRVATNGDLRMEATPGQWQPVPKQLKREIEGNAIVTTLCYPDSSRHLTGFNPTVYPDYQVIYKVRVEPQGDGILVTVDLDKPVPEFLLGKVGFNLEFYPGDLFGKPWLMDNQSGVYPRQPNGPLLRTQPNQLHNGNYHQAGKPLADMKQLNGKGYSPMIADDIIAEPYAVGRKFTSRPDEVMSRLTVESFTGDLKLYDGRMNHNNGWFVLRSEIARGATKGAVRWKITPARDPDWRYDPVIQTSQVGYHPQQPKRAIIETDRRENIFEDPGVSVTGGTLNISAGKVQHSVGEILSNRVYLCRLDAERETVVRTIQPKLWGDFLRYKYYTADFSDVTEPGLYYVRIGTRACSEVFRIADNVYDRGVWQPVIEYFLPVQMCHMRVAEKYRVWHDYCHMDDALMAKAGNHIDGYDQKSGLSKFAELQPVPGVNVGGWHDAGDFDLRIESQAGEAYILALAYELFHPEIDVTAIDQQNHRVEIHEPDGRNDILQQIENGALTVVRSYQALGRLYRGIICNNVRQYVLLGDASAMTDGVPGNDDDRWIFTEDNPQRALSTVAQLAGASRVLKGFNDALAAECLQIAKDVYEQTQVSGWAESAKLQAAIELWFATGDQKFKDFFTPLVEAQLNPQPVQAPSMANGRGGVGMNLSAALEVYPYMDKKFQDKVKALIPAYVKSITAVAEDNPYGVNIAGATWAGNSGIINNAYNCYKVWKLFPDMIDPEFVFAGLNYLFGCHPYNNKSFITAVGVTTKNVAYSNNRADYSVIPGGVVPGLLVKEDFFENKDDYPFHWGENECCINDAPRYVELVLGAIEVAQALNK